MKSIYFLFCLALPTFVFATDDIGAIQPLFRKYCIACHGHDKQKGDIRLDRLHELDGEALQSVYEQIAGDQMPPDNKPQPTDEESPDPDAWSATLVDRSAPMS